MLVDDTSYHDETPEEVIEILERSRKFGNRINIRYGDVATGRDWGDPRMIGKVGRSTGRVKIPLLIKTRTSTGGQGILDNCIVRITESVGGRVLYEHPSYHRGQE